MEDRPTDGYPVRFRVWVGGVEADDVTIIMLGPDDSAIAEVASQQADICIQAEANGQRYLVDISFPDGEHVRWGTDFDGMVMPMEVALENLANILARDRQ